ncbi:MAG: C4-type zinc ribbon domain-containing protein [Candidatus Omnitrophota bacterium]
MSEETNYKGQLAKLIQLQEYDAEIYGLKARKGGIPVRIEGINSAIEKRKGNMNKADEDLKVFQVARSQKETEMGANEEKIKKHEGNLYQIKNNKEYQALLGEIKSIKADVSLQEEEIINLLDQIGNAKNKFEEEKKIFEEEKSKLNKEQEDIKAEEKRIVARLDELEPTRKQYAQDIDKNILDRYDRVLELRGGIALAKVNGEVCSECSMTLRPQIINEAKLKREPVFCENCSRILYVED